MASISIIFCCISDKDAVITLAIFLGFGFFFLTSLGAFVWLSALPAAALDFFPVLFDRRTFEALLAALGRVTFFHVSFLFGFFEKFQLPSNDKHEYLLCQQLRRAMKLLSWKQNSILLLKTMI